jgi:two-component system, NarL family, nitrate/nitrite response regulator NarL
MAVSHNPVPVASFNSSTLRLVILDALALSRDALRVVLAAEGRFSVVGAACDCAEAVRFVRAYRPHVVLLDVAEPGVSGLDALRTLRDSDTGVSTVVLVDAMTGIEVVNALTLGARGVLLKDASPLVLYACVRAVAEGAYWIGTECVCDVVEAVRRVREEALPAPAGELTPRELQVVAAILGGATNRDIGLRLDVSVDTVKRLLRQVFAKVGVSRRFELALYAARHLFHDHLHTARTVGLRHDPVPRGHDRRTEENRPPAAADASGSTV